MERVRVIGLSPLAGAVGLSLLFGFGGCAGETDSGRLTGPGAQVAAVGQELNISLELAGAQGDVSYNVAFDRQTVGNLRTVVRPDGSALVTFRPTGQDLGELVLSASARDGVGYAETEVPIEVRSTIGSATVPKFNRPQGEGTAIQTERDNCVELEVQIEDQDTSQVDIVQVPPLIEGGNLQPDGPGAAIWRWCPTPEQRAERSRYVLTLGADDRENPKTLKRYLIVLHDGEKLGCPGTAPVVEHTAVDHDTVNALEIRARVTDAEGLGGAPLVYFNANGRADPTQLRQLAQVTMQLESGDDRDGEWVARLPNPALQVDVGQPVPLEYLIIASDNDGRGNGCNHKTTETFAVQVTRPAVDGGQTLCEPCDADVQCGGEGDLCLTTGGIGETACFKGCASDTECPSGFYCSPEALTSVDGATGRQCVPENDVCEISECDDDRFEPNGQRDVALPLAAGENADLVMCPIGHLVSDEDWYKIELDTDSDVTVNLLGDVYPNMDLRLFDESGALVAASEDWGSTDSVTRCLPAGDYYARVYSAFAGENRYSLDLRTSPSNCPVAECTDDPFEDDDNAAEARLPDFEGFVYRATGNHICSGDQDYFKVYLFGDETVYGTLTFEQTTPTEDLDFLVYDEAGNLLTPCTADDFSGCSENGQSGTSNETFQFTAPSAQFYYVAVNGFDGAENDYDVCLSVEETDPNTGQVLCPSP